VTIETGLAAWSRRGAASVRPFRPGDERAILTGMLAAKASGEYDAVEPYQLEAAVGRLPHDPGSCAVADLDGRVVGWVIPADDDLMVLPQFRRRGIGRRLVAAGRDIAAATGRDRLRLWVPRRPGPEAFARACGLRHTSSLWQMRLAGGRLAAAPAPEFPTGVTLRAFAPGADEEPFTELVNTAFLDHPAPLRLTADEVRRSHTSPGFDPTTVLVVEDAASGVMTGFCRILPFTADDGSRAGEIRLLGVLPEWRGRGLGRAVTAWGVTELRRRGAAAVILAVEGENSGALHLYSGLGFEFAVEWPHWTIRATPARG
jgi:mycothiol synthase